MGGWHGRLPAQHGKRRAAPLQVAVPLGLLRAGSHDRGGGGGKGRGKPRSHLPACLSASRPPLQLACISGVVSLSMLMNSGEWKEVSSPYWARRGRCGQGGEAGEMGGVIGGGSGKPRRLGPTACRAAPAATSKLRCRIYTVASQRQRRGACPAGAEAPRRSCHPKRCCCTHIHLHVLVQAVPQHQLMRHRHALRLHWVVRTIVVAGIVAWIGRRGGRGSALVRGPGGVDRRRRWRRGGVVGAFAPAMLSSGQPLRILRRMKGVTGGQASQAGRGKVGSLHSTPRRTVVEIRDLVLATAARHLEDGGREGPGTALRCCAAQASIMVCSCYHCKFIGRSRHEQSARRRCTRSCLHSTAARPSRGPPKRAGRAPASQSRSPYATGPLLSPERSPLALAR